MKDYANRKDIVNQASRTYKQASSRASGDHVPKKLGWWVVGVIVVLGVSITLAIALWPVHRANHHAKTKAQQAKAAASDSQPNDSNTQSGKSAKTEQPKFDFYRVLPADQQASQAITNDSSTATDNATYKLEVASYQDKKLAESLRSKLLLMDLKPVIEQDKAGDYQVNLGPFDNAQDYQKVQQQLRSHGITGTTLYKMTATSS